MEPFLNSAIVLKEFTENVKAFLQNSYSEFEKKGYKKIVENNQKPEKNTPFLSIIVRTQGKREESLREVLLCLKGQEYQDFEVLIIGHKLQQEQFNLVQKVIMQQDEDLRKKIRYIPLEYGNRTVPLNIGFANAWGQYIATLDDDDLVLDNWVLNFYNAAQKYNGRVLYNYTLAQDWSVIGSGEYKGGLRAESAFDTEFARDYKEVLQVELNRCPPVGLAYPSCAFQEMGIIFDEELATTEDWDYLMRVAYVCGVHSCREPSCIYRKWINAETSFTVHKPEEWTRNYETIIKKTNSRMMCFPAGAASTIVQLIKDRSWLLSEERGSSNTHVFDYERVYIKTDKGYSEDYVMHASQIQVNHSGDFIVEYKIQDVCKNCIHFRWDPIEKGILVLKDFSIAIKYNDGMFILIKQDKVKHNGWFVDNHLVFAQRDPQILFTMEKVDQVNQIVFQGNVSETLSLEILEKISEQKGRALSILKRLKI